MARQSETSFLAPKVSTEIENWLRHLGAERRLSPKTLEAYRRDVLQFLSFLAEHLRAAPSLGALRGGGRGAVVPAARSGGPGPALRRRLALSGSAGAAARRYRRRGRRAR